MFYFLDQICPICGEGVIGFRLCDDGVTIVLMCVECDSIWKSPLEVGNGIVYGTDAPDWQIAELGCGIGKGSRWASKKEIIDYGWEEYIGGEGEHY